MIESYCLGRIMKLGLAGLLLTMVGLSGSASAEGYTITDLGLQGHQGWAMTLNNSGQVHVYHISPNEHTAIWDDGKFISVGTLREGWFGESMNNAAQISGYFREYQNEWLHEAHLWTEGVWSPLGTLGWPNSRTEGVNDAGHVVGYLYDTSQHPAWDFLSYVWKDGVMESLQILDARDSFAHYINNAGQIAGKYRLEPYGDYRCYLYEDEEVTPLRPVGDDCYVYGLNDLGHVLVYHVWYGTWGWIYKDGDWEQIPHLNVPPIPPRSHVWPYAMNNHDDVVGTHYKDFHTQTVFLYTDGVTAPLSTFVEPDADWGHIRKATDINDAGQIIAEMRYIPEWKYKPVLLTPPGLLLLGPRPGRAGEINQFFVKQATPNGNLAAYVGTEPGATPVSGCPGLMLDLVASTRRVTGKADGEGEAAVPVPIAADRAGALHYMQAVDLTACTKSNLSIHRYP